MKAIIKNKKEVAEGTLSVDFELLRNVDFIPGQYFFVTLIDPPYIDKKGNQRHFSIISSPKEKILSMATRIREESAFKRSLRDMPIGSKVEIGEIGGSFVLPKNPKKPIVLIATGIGITPYIGMLRNIKREDYNITLVYSNRNEKLTAFLEELKSMDNIKLILIMSDNHRGARRIDEQFIKEYFPDFKSLSFYISGSPKVVEAINKVLFLMDIKDIKKDSFSGY